MKLTVVRLFQAADAGWKARATNFKTLSFDWSGRKRSAPSVIASGFCEAIPDLVDPDLQRGDCFVAKTAPRNDT
ncbi:MAG: hypothetical protein HZC40_05900 [Chloroflexi bacterium]|nr:hypothetical protein [Chloroflexota bacterium]